jgi:sigma-54 dependent transcriptional regulator, acetoin dehydrogenase operon transcriptional activator AcoR
MSDAQLVGPFFKEEQASPTIALSWRRCSDRGLDPAQAPDLISDKQALRQVPPAIARHLAIVRPAMEDVYQFIEGSQSAIAFADSDGRLHDLIGDPEFLEDVRTIGWTIGSCWNEERAGTNGLALALIDSFPTQVRGNEHYWSLLTSYCTAGAPIYDSLGGLIGALAVITPVERWSLHTLGMISAAAGAVTGELHLNLWQGSANELLSELNAIVQTLSEGILLLQSDGTIKQMNGRAGQLLGVAPTRVVGRRLAEVVETPAPIETALSAGREMYDEEVVFHAQGTRIVCLCTLRAIASALQDVEPPMALTTSTPAPGRPGKPQTTGLHVTPQGPKREYVLTLRSIERVQRLVHRMSGAQARMRFGNIVGESPALLEAIRLAKIAAQSASTVLLHGETGTGKEIFAQSIHNGGPRADGPFVAVNCAAIPRELISSELFGYEGGAFTGADRQGRPGKFELASGGTLFLDEVGDMPRDLQTSLLRALETRTIVRVGGQNVIPVDVRIITATHKDLDQEVQRGDFRSDLYFRLNVFPIEVPSLRERPGDVALLLQHSLQRLSTRLRRSLSIEAEALAALEAYSWPGNVRELENVIERAVYVSETGAIRLSDLSDQIRALAAHIPARPSLQAQYGALGAAPLLDTRVDAPPQQPHEPAQTGGQGALSRPLRQESETAEAALIQRTLVSYGGNVTQAAASLGISRTTLWRKKARYGL